MTFRRKKSVNEKTITLPADFNEKQYLEKYEDVADAVNSGHFTSGADHFQQYGYREGRDPNPAPDVHAVNDAAVNTMGRDGLPVPSPDLMFLVTHGRDADVFLDCGEADLRLVRRAVEEAGVNLPETGMRVLDWGCGCGRLARFWAAEADKVELFGCDINPTLVSWCQDNIPFGRFSVSPFDPPLTYADGSFDLLYGISVFTHLTFDEHYLWMREIHRLLAPHGVAVLTGHGPTMLPTILAGAQAAYETGAVRTDLIDHESFVCLEHAAGSNSTGNVLSQHMFSQIFRPFDVRLQRARYGLMGIHDTYVVTKKTGGELVFLNDVSTAPLEGNDTERSIPIELAGRIGFSALVHAENLFYPATACCTLRSVETNEALVEPVIVELADKVAWTSLNQAHTLVAFDNILPCHGNARLVIEVRANYLHNVILNLTKIMIY